MITATKCKCGAITVTDQNNSFSNSMTKETFNRLFPALQLQSNIYWACDHCINNWGLDLCNCGSGLSVEECDCEEKIAAQTLFEQKPFLGWVR